ncbi:hypothetical protein ACIQWY_30035 [Streptomyces albidoflavus]
MNSDSALEQRIALVACGRTRPGKTRACDRCQKKGPALRSSASRGPVALAATICGSDPRRACTSCVDKATEIIRICAEEAA